MTQPTLIYRLKEVGDEEAWDRFFRLYTPLILGFSQSRGCDREMAQEVLQESMVCLMTELVSFSYDPERGRFRSYLLAIVNNRIRRAFQRRAVYTKRHTVLSEKTEDQSEEFIGAGDDEYPGQDWDDMWHRNLALQALRQVQTRVGDVTYKSFVLNVLRGWPISEIASEMNLSANQIYQHKDRVKKMLRQEYNRLLEEIGEES